MQNPYESERVLAEYLYFHYPPDDAGPLPIPVGAVGFPRRVVAELLDGVDGLDRALDVGCAVGGTAFELARLARGVVGIDFSSSFIAAADELRRRGELECNVPVEGGTTSSHVARVRAGIDRSRVSFEVGDAMALRGDLGSFDAVVAANLVCRLAEPLKFLDRLPDLVIPGGHLVLATPFSWLAEYTPVENWLGGTELRASGWMTLREVLSPSFELEQTRDLPFLILEHSRKYQYGISLGSRWRRR